MAFLSLGAVLGVPAGSLAYEEDVHFFLSMFLADAAGFPLSDAALLARFDQATDDDPATTPMPSRSDPLAISHRALYHFVNAEQLIALEAAAFRSCDMKQMGQYLHAVEDFYSHRKYEPVLGHLFSRHAPDKPYRDPEVAIMMAGKKFAELVRLAEACRPSTVPRTRWKGISDQVSGFLSAQPPDPQKEAGWNTDRDRLKILVPAGKVVEYQQKWQDYQIWRQQQGW